MTGSAFQELKRELTPEILPLTDMGDWQALAREPVDSIFEEGLAAGKLGVLVAEGGTGKSFLALELALSVAMGQKLIDGFTPSKAGRVLCLFGEDDKPIIVRRLDAICKALNLPPTSLDVLFKNNMLEIIAGKSAPLFMPGGPLRSPAFKELESRCRENAYRLVIVDPLIAFAGIENENDNAMMQQVALALIELANACGGAVLTLHHANKSGTSSGNMSQALSRGASSLLCAARWVAALRTLSDKEAESFDLDAGQAENHLELRIAKNSYAPRSGQKRYLERREGGALISVELREAVTRRTAEAIAQELGENGAGLTRHEIVKGTGSLAKSFRDAVAKRVSGKSTQNQIGKALDFGLRERMFFEREIESGRRGAKRVEIVPNA